MSSGVESPPSGEFDGPAAVAADLAVIRDRIRTIGARLAALRGQFRQLHADIDRHQAARVRGTGA